MVHDSFGQLQMRLYYQLDILKYHQIRYSLWAITVSKLNINWIFSKYFDLSLLFTLTLITVVIRHQNNRLIEHFANLGQECNAKTAYLAKIHPLSISKVHVTSVKFGFIHTEEDLRSKQNAFSKRSALFFSYCR